MKLHSPRFEKALRRGVKRELRSSPELAVESRRGKTIPWKRWLEVIWIAVLMVFPGFAAWTAAQTTGHVATGLAVMNLAVLYSLSWLACLVWYRLHTPAEIVALAVLPILRERFFHWQMQRVLVPSLRVLVVLLLGFATLAGLYDFPPWKWAAALLVAALTWAAVLAMAVFCAARFPRWPFDLLLWGLVIGVYLVVVGNHFILPVALQALDKSAPELNLVLPSGWPVSMFQTLTAEKPRWFLAFFLPVSVVLATTADSLKRLFARLQYLEYVAPDSSDLIPEALAAAKPASGAPLQLGPTAIEEIIRSRTFLEQSDWPRRGWLESRLWRWFSPREQALSDFVFPNGCAITLPWRRIFGFFGIITALAFFASMIDPRYKIWGLATGLFGSGMMTMGQISNSGKAFQPLQFGGVKIPMYAGHCTGFSELSQLLFKCSIVQIPLLLTLTLTAGAATAWLAGFPMGTGLAYGLKAGCLMFASRFILLTLAFSAGTNDTSRLIFRSFMVVFLNGILGLMFLGLGAAGLFVPHQPVALLCCLGAILDAYAFFWVYKQFYISGGFDLMSLNRQ